MERDEVAGPTINEAGEQLRGDIEMMRHVVAEKTEQIRQTVHTLANEHPLATVGVAFGVGYLLAGGLYSKTTARLLMVGGRFLLGAAVRSAVASGGLGMLGSLLEGKEAEATSTTSQNR